MTLGWPEMAMATRLGQIRSGRRGGEAGLARRRSPVPVKTNVPLSRSRSKAFAHNFMAIQLAARPKERLDAQLNTKPGARPEKRLDARLDTCSLKLSPRSGLTLGWPDRHMAMTLGPIRSGRRGGVAGLTRRRSPVPVKTNVSWSWSRPEVFDISWHACLKLR